MLNKKISILVSSCDKYSDLWGIFSYYFKKNWKDCSLDKYIISNFSNNSPKDFKNIRVGNDKSWSNNLILSLKKISTPYVLILLDDVFIKNKVDNSLFEKICIEFINTNGNYLKFLSHPKSNYKTDSKFFNYLPENTLYRSTAVFALWKKSTILRLLNPDENAWEFEENGSIRSDKYNGFFTVNKNFFSYIHGVVRGKFLYSAYLYIRKNDPELIPLIKRGVNKRSAEYFQILINFRHKIFYALVPLRYRRDVKKILKNLF